jgi:hypothetical protein
VIVKVIATFGNPVDHKRPRNCIPDNRGIKINPEKIKNSQQLGVLPLKSGKGIVIFHLSIELCRPTYVTVLEFTPENAATVDARSINWITVRIFIGQ